jgi:hypothetical protein
VPRDDLFVLGVVASITAKGFAIPFQVMIYDRSANLVNVVVVVMGTRLGCTGNSDEDVSVIEVREEKNGGNATQEIRLFSNG